MIVIILGQKEILFLIFKGISWSEILKSDFYLSWDTRERESADFSFLIFRILNFWNLKILIFEKSYNYKGYRR